MNNLFDFSKWKKFKVGDILQRKKIKSVSSIIGDLEDGNDIVVGNSAINNGVIQYKNITDKIYINPSNVLSYGAKGGKFFYQSKQWSSTDHVHMFVSEKLNEYTQSFLCTVLNHMLKVKGGWQSSLESSVLDEIIMLPSDNSGNPDWQFMEDYIKALRERERESTELAECYEVKQLQPFEQIKWKEFLLNQIFKFEKGKCSNAPDLEDGNDIPYVGAKKTENGIMKWVKLEQNLVSKGNAISFICQGEGSNGYCNYFDIDTIQTTSNTLAYNPKLNKFNALFLVTLLDLERPKWSFGRGRSPKLGETKIKLPINSQNEIDWQYMEDYVKALRERERESTQVVLKTTLLKFLNLDSSYWIKFPIKQFFNITRGKRIVFNEDYFANKDEQNIYPVITATSRNNSVDGYYFAFNCNGNCICCGGEAAGMLSTYQMDKCWVMDRSRILSPKFKEFNKYLAMFFITLINTNQYRFSYGRSANPIDIEKILIPLPVNINNQPDWEYIEEYIKSLPYSKYI